MGAILDIGIVTSVYYFADSAQRQLLANKILAKKKSA